MSGIYVHIPFCKSRCAYCDFYSTSGLATKYGERYVNALIREYELRSHTYNTDKATTLYIGGGTPSQLSINLIERLAKSLKSNTIEEFTIEVNPDDITPRFADSIIKAGVNRVSIGIQSFIDRELALINRRHSAQQAIDAVKLFQSKGLSNISIDLIYGLPEQTLTSWQQSVNIALSLGIKHISAYNLSVEYGTELWHRRESGEFTEACEQLSIDMYDTLCSLLRQAGFEHYEISNFAIHGYRSRHNSSYWNFTPYLGLGAAAHSYDGTCRYYNPPSITQYLECIEAGKLAIETEELQWWEQYDELVMLRLRTADGLNATDIRKRFGQSAYDAFLEKASPSVKSGKLMRNGDIFTLNPNAIMISDHIISQLMHDTD